MHSEKVKNKIYVNLFVLLIIFGIWYLFISPQYSGHGNFYSPTDNIKALEKQKQDMSGALAVIRQYDKRLGDTNQKYLNALNSLPVEELNKILPTTADPIVVVYELTELAARPETNMLLDSPKVSENKASGKQKYGVLSVSFNVEGSYNALKNLLQNFENSKRIYNVTSLSFTSPQDSTQAQVYKYNITVETYFLDNSN